MNCLMDLAAGIFRDEFTVLLITEMSFIIIKYPKTDCKW